MRITLDEIARLTRARLEGDPNAVIHDASSLADSGPTDIAFLENRKYAGQLPTCRAGAVFLSPADRDLPGGPSNRLYTDQPRLAYAQVLERIYAEKWKPLTPALSPKADIHFEARLGKDVDVGPYTVIRGRTIIGDGTRIGAQCYLGYNVRIGKDCLIHPRVVIQDYCTIGDRVILHPGVVLGSDGFGYWTDPKTGCHRKIPQVGRVVLEDDVELGANVTIDRATAGDTRIGAGTKIDNLVQIGHNVRIGPNGILVSQVGIAGSTEVGRQVTLAGQVGVAGHLKIGDRAVVTAQSGVMSDIDPGAVVFGSPTRPHREAMKLQALLNRLPEMYETLKRLTKKEASHAKK
ncbi:MAG: UDP-3-O-(3-hydroxymyristoyl)glucosamine N-acyltransferase [Elusimicrobiota bacterium]